MMKRRDILTGLFFALIGGLVVPATAEEMQSYKYEEIQDAAMGKVVARCMICLLYTSLANSSPVIDIKLVSVVEVILTLLISSQYFLRGWRERQLLKEEKI